MNRYEFQRFITINLTLWLCCLGIYLSLTLWFYEIFEYKIRIGEAFGFWKGSFVGIFLISLFYHWGHQIFRKVERE